MTLLYTLCLLAAIPRFQGPFPVLSGGTPIDVGMYGVPLMADWTQDGRKDLVVGQFDSGFVRCYPNVGTDSSPEFNGFFYIEEASGSRVKMPFSWCQGSCPQVVDWNSDGVRDLIAGDRYGYLNVFIQTDSGLVAHYKVLKQSGDTFDVGYGCAPTVMDWNADGKKDLIAGREAALTYLYINVGSDSWPIFQDSVIMSAGGSWIVFGRGQPTAFDIDQDGRKDVIYGEIGGSVHCFRNIGPDSNPQLVRADTLKTVDGRLIKPSGVANTSKCGFGDWNNDGTPDFLISGQEGMVDLYLGATQSGVEDTPSLTFQPSSLRIEPNPATGGFANLRIQGVGYSSNPAADVRVFDVLGQCVLARPLDHLTTGPLPLDLRGLRAGVYLVRLTAGETCAGAKLVVR